ncbi:MAG: hypothetical protein LW750_01340 [Bacteroidetes bacterium]|jgi:hypothetical protein|nr:hypothetical protein [Bacteroidota bacterium]
MRKSMVIAFLLCMAVLGADVAFAQTSPKADISRKIIQFSGLLLDADSLYPIPYAAVVIRNTTRGEYSSATGFYSLVVQEKDTVDFYALGYKRGSFVVPDTFTTSTFNHVQALQLDTILLREMVVYPWPSREKFKTEFLSMEVPSDDLDRARKNLARAEMIQAIQQVSMDGGMAYRAKMDQQVQRNYYAGQYVPNNLMNPLAWSKFIQAVQNGEFRNR